MNHRVSRCLAIAAFSVCFTMLAKNTVQAAGFDCARASTKIEKTICADPHLSAMDGELAVLYQRAQAHHRSSPDTVSALRASQRSWLKETRDVCQDGRCLVAAYERRVSSMRIGLEKLGLDLSDVRDTVDLSTQGGSSPAVSATTRSDSPAAAPPLASPVAAASGTRQVAEAPKSVPDAAAEMRAALVGKWASKEDSAPTCNGKDVYLLRGADGSMLIVSPADIVTWRGQWNVERTYGNGVAVIRTNKQGEEAKPNYFAYKLEGQKVRTNSDPLTAIPSTYNDALAAAMRPLAFGGEVFDKAPGFYRCSESAERATAVVEAKSARSSRDLAEQLIAKSIRENALFQRHVTARNLMANSMLYTYIHGETRCGKQWTDPMRTALGRIVRLDHMKPGLNDGDINVVAATLQGQMAADGCGWSFY